MTLFKLAHWLVWRTTWLHQTAGMQPGKPLCMLQKHNPCSSLKFWSNLSWQSNNTKPLSLGLRAGSHGVPSPTHVSKAKHAGKVPTIEPQQTLKVWFTSIKIRSWLFYAKNSQDLYWELGLAFLLEPTLNIRPEPHLQKVLPCRHPCHTWDLGLGARVKWWVPTSMLSMAKLAGIDLK
jgi:hypothetical protein